MIMKGTWRPVGIPRHRDGSILDVADSCNFDLDLVIRVDNNP